MPLPSPDQRTPEQQAALVLVTRQYNYLLDGLFHRITDEAESQEIPLDVVTEALAHYVDRQMAEAYEEWRGE